MLALLILGLCVLCAAQSIGLTFSLHLIGECPVIGSLEAITFTTASFLNTFECFNIEDLFSVNTSDSYGSRSYRTLSSSDPDTNDWRVSPTPTKPTTPQSCIIKIRLLGYRRKKVKMPSVFWKCTPVRVANRQTPIPTPSILSLVGLVRVRELEIVMMLGTTS
ncbi:hypothetical protein D6C85_00368 [Aureobasidium pullulans]|uniref:Uncharacterized protein n=1 Tax=Aureobasidium pullulans TaxID=5580 RepID=A0A4S9XLR8_AURPU|nr:hypothetical protein D6C85_00368 [Aureobasidium pullulans]